MYICISIYTYTYTYFLFNKVFRVYIRSFWGVRGVYMRLIYRVSITVM